jgi:hypothetical protein
LKADKQHSALYLNSVWKSAGVLIVLCCLAIPAFSQNTKGDSPVGNQRRVRETKMKSIKRKDRSTKDISGHRLRTKNTSSTSRANANYPTPSPYADRKKVKSDRAAKAAPRYTARPSDRQRPWTGDISGKPLRVVARNKKLSRNNLYPSKIHTRTATGEKIIRVKPDNKQRAWKGGIDHGPVRNQTATGKTSNVYPKNGRYETYSKKRLKTKEGSGSNRAVIGLTSRLSPGPPRGKGMAPKSASGNFVRRGKKNVYWGKFSAGEKPVTRDLTGRQVRTRNFHSMPAGTVNYDSLSRINKRRAGGDRPYRGTSGGFSTASRRGQRAWTGDVSGHKLRTTNPKKRTETAGEFLFPRKLSISQSGGKPGRQLPGGGYSSRSRTRMGSQPVPVKSPGIGAVGIDGKGNRGFRPGFDTQGGGYSGATKAKRQAKGGGSVSGKLWNNGQSPVGVRTPGQVQAGSYQGNIPRGKEGNYRDQGEGFAGFNKASRPVKGGGSVSGKLWNNRQSPVGVRTPGQVQAGSYQGNIPRGKEGNYRDQGEGFAGYTKAKRPVKGGGSVSGKLWNNGQSPVGVRTPGQIQAGSYQGNIPRDRGDNYRDQGEGFAGFIKAKRPVKGGGSITTQWNNNQSPIGVRTPGEGSIRAGSYQGNIPRETVRDYRDQGEGFAGYIKAKRPVKGGGSITTQWNNNESPIDVRIPGSGSMKAGSFAGNIKASKPKKGGGSISGHWNNNEQPIEVRSPAKGAMAMNYSGKEKSDGYRQNPNAAKESTMKQRPDKTTYQVAGLQIKVKEGDYKEKPHAAKGSLPGVAPSRSSVKANDYTGNLKVYWEYRHNPSSADEAPKALYFGKAVAHIAAYQGNVKMHKYNDKNLHPDAQFAHSVHDNVKGEKTVMMELKLAWAKVFGKNDTQPENLKEKSERPRYDKGEKGLWLDDPAYEKKQQSKAER